MAVQVQQVGLVHGQHHVELAEIAFLQRARAQSVQAVAAQVGAGAGAGIGQHARRCMGACRINLHLPRQPRIGHAPGKHGLGRRAAAEVAHADKENGKGAHAASIASALL